MLIMVCALEVCRNRRFRSRHAAGRREQVREPATELGLVDAGLVIVVLSGSLSLLDALGGVTPPPRGLRFGFQVKKARPAQPVDEDAPR
jgi:hypothetical protein